MVTFSYSKPGADCLNACPLNSNHGLIRSESIWQEHSVYTWAHKEILLGSLKMPVEAQHVTRYISSSLIFYVGRYMIPTLFQELNAWRQGCASHGVVGCSHATFHCSRQKVLCKRSRRTREDTFGATTKPVKVINISSKATAPNDTGGLLTEAPVGILTLRDNKREGIQKAII